MKQRRRLATLITLISACVTLAAYGEDCGTSFQSRVQPIFDTRCVACHMSGSAAGNLNLEDGESLQAMLGVKSAISSHLRIDPQSPESSVLLLRLTGTSEGQRMPMDRPPLSDAKIGVIRDWLMRCASLIKKDSG